MCYYNQRYRIMITEKELYLITDEKQRLYFTGYQSTDGYLVLGRNFKYFVIDSRYYYAAQKLLAKRGITTILGSDYSALKQIVTEKGIEVIGVDYTKTTMADYEVFVKEGYKLKDVSQEIKNSMLIKSIDDLKKTQKACKIAELALKQIMPLIKEGIKERKLAAELEYRMKMLGASGTSFETIVAFGENTAVPHHVTGETTLKQNMPVLIDFGCVYKGFCSDMTRTFYYGTPDQEFIDAYNAVYLAHVKAAESIVEGTDCVTADGYARNILKEKGLDKYFTHSLGHGIGVNIHEAPALSPRGKGTLKERMVFSIEPGVYFDGKFGIRIEDSVTIYKGKVKSFMTFSKRLKILK